MRHLETERRKPKTLVKYRGIFDRLVQMAEGDGRKTVDQIDISFLDNYRHARVTAGRAAKTVHDETVIIRQLVKFAMTRGMLATDPLKGF